MRKKESKRKWVDEEAGELKQKMESKTMASWISIAQSNIQRNQERKERHLRQDAWIFTKSKLKKANENDKSKRQEDMHWCTI